MPKSPRSYSMANVMDPTGKPKKSNIERTATLKEEKKEEADKKKIEKKKGCYVGATKEVYEFLKKEYNAKWGIAFTIEGGITTITKSNLPQEKKEEKLKAEIQARGKILADFWEQYIMKSQKGKLDKSSFSASQINEPKKSEENTRKEKMQSYSKVDVEFTIYEDIGKEIKDIVKKEEMDRKKEEILKDSKKSEKEKRMFQKGLDLTYKFDRENMEE